MQKSLISGVCVIALALASLAAGVGQAAAPRAQLTSFVCQRALDPPARGISVTAVMRPVTGTRSLELKFDLLSKLPGATAYAPVTGLGLGTWVTPPNPTLGRRAHDTWIVHHPVLDLVAATYRFRVSFRWLGSHGKVLTTAIRNSPRCRQPELRPDLLVRSFTAQAIAGHPKLNRYTALIRNAGSSAAKGVVVQFTDGTKTGSATVARLAAHARRTVTFTGPVCHSAAPPTLSIDPQHVLDESDTANNTAQATCPAGS